MLYNLIITPIETLASWIFAFMLDKFKFLDVIGAVFGVSLAINFLALPLYNIADSLQEKERNLSRSLNHWTTHIKKTFKGDEQFMMLSAYYKQNNYHPLYVLRSSLTILIEIPFFIAAYHFLSHNEALKGSSFWIFKDLGSPDGLLHIGNFPIHILPIIMTLINVVSGAIYAKNGTAREKIQLYGIALVFLALLYNSPTGLVIYWILNNIFSLVKNIVLKMKNPGRILHTVISLLIFMVVMVFWFLKPNTSVAKKGLLTIIFLLFASAPYIIAYLKSKNLLQTPLHEKYAYKESFTLLIFSGLSLTLLAGLLLPSSVISSSPAEFSFLGKTENPLSYVWSSFFVFAGFFLFWPVAVYKLFDKKVRFWLPVLLTALLCCALLNVFVFKPDYGNLNSAFFLDDKKVLINKTKFLTYGPLLALILILAVISVSIRFKKAICTVYIAVIISLAEFAVGMMNVNKISTQYKTYEADLRAEKIARDSRTGIEPVFHLSKTEKNVVIIFLDRAVGFLVPYIFEQFPEFNQEYSGFVYYPNTLSFSTQTLLGSPGMCGGYEYSVPEINKRSDVLLREKHNEAILLAPCLFHDAGYDVSAFDVPCTNYHPKNDPTLFEERGMRAENILGRYTEDYLVAKGKTLDTNNDSYTRTGTINFSVLQMIYHPFRWLFYVLTLESGMDYVFENSFSCLYFMRELTDFTNTKPTFTFIGNDTNHEYRFLNAPYYDEKSVKRNDSTGTYIPHDDQDFMAYHNLTASFIQLSKWVKYLKENDCYDNTRIIMVADHGRNLHCEQVFSGFENPRIPAHYNPLLMVKDFNSTGPVKTDTNLMTNADTIFFAKEGLGLSNINPFTGKELIQNKKDGVIVVPAVNWEWTQYTIFDKYQFTIDKTKSYLVRDNIFNPDNWIPLE